MSELTNIEFEHIRLDGGTQTREQLNDSSVSEYTEAFKNGAAFPPVTVFFDGSSFWLADGFHRYSACKDAGFDSILANIINGTKRDAILFSKGANSDHGLPRSNAIKRKVVNDMLNDAEWSTWSQEKIAKACGVSTGFVSKLVNEASLHGEEIKPQTRTVERNGKTYEQNTANIGKNTATPKPENQAQPVVNPESYVMPDEEEKYTPPATDFEQMYHDAEKDNGILLEQIKSLNKPDVTEEIASLHLQLDQLRGRLEGEINTKNEAQKQAKYYADLLGKIRKALNVDSNSKILAELGAR